mmetsp:Transcript_109662/g.342924  ORF Transcript_109662/g.342924 Transcript_109662/m.342924 type:complete len:524 (+) Transcript_109662:343-1914(+)
MRRPWSLGRWTARRVRCRALRGLHALRCPHSGLRLAARPDSAGGRPARPLRSGRSLSRCRLPGGCSDHRSRRRNLVRPRGSLLRRRRLRLCSLRCGPLLRCGRRRGRGPWRRRGRLRRRRSAGGRLPGRRDALRGGSPLGWRRRRRKPHLGLRATPSCSAWEGPPLPRAADGAVAGVGVALGPRALLAAVACPCLRHLVGDLRLDLCSSGLSGAVGRSPVLLRCLFAPGRLVEIHTVAWPGPAWRRKTFSSLPHALAALFALALALLALLSLLTLLALALVLSPRPVRQTPHQRLRVTDGLLVALLARRVPGVAVLLRVALVSELAAQRQHFHVVTEERRLREARRSEYLHSGLDALLRRSSRVDQVMWHPDGAEDVHDDAQHAPILQAQDRLQVQHPAAVQAADHDEALDDRMDLAHVLRLVVRSQLARDAVIRYNHGRVVVGFCNLQPRLVRRSVGCTLGLSILALLLSVLPRPPPRSRRFCRLGGGPARTRSRAGAFGSRPGACTRNHFVLPDLVFHLGL